VPNFAQNVRGVAVDDSKPFAVVDPQIVRKKGEHGDNYRDPEHVVFDHEFPPGSVNSAARRHLPVLAEDDGEFAGFLGYNLAATGH
jgi:hypothetical protein